jgi:putative tricarboxylic transport membrane protein
VAEKNRNRKIAAVALFAFSIFYLFFSMKLKMGAPKNPGPGFVPAWIGVLLILTTGYHLISVLKACAAEGKAESPTAQGEKNYLAIYGTLACTLLYPFILETLKFLISTSLVSFLMLFLLQPRKPVFSIFLALVISVVSFIVFSRLLGVGLPNGYLEVLLFRIGG